MIFYQKSTIPFLKLIILSSSEAEVSTFAPLSRHLQKP